MGKVDNFLKKITSYSTLLGTSLLKSGFTGIIAGLSNAVLSGKIVLPIGLAFGFDIIINKTLLLWGGFPLLFDSIWSRMFCSITVVVIGFLFYLLRERRLFVYASVEIGAAAATAYNASAKLYTSHDNNAALITLLGSVYISVRAFDNFNKAYFKKRVK